MLPDLVPLLKDCRPCHQIDISYTYSTGEMTGGQCSDRHTPSDPVRFLRGRCAVHDTIARRNLNAQKSKREIRYRQAGGRDALPPSNNDVAALDEHLIKFWIRSVLRFYQCQSTNHARDVLTREDWKQIQDRVKDGVRRLRDEIRTRSTSWSRLGYSSQENLKFLERLRPNAGQHLVFEHARTNLTLTPGRRLHP